MSRDDYQARPTDPDSSRYSHRWKNPGREEQTLRTLQALERFEARRWFTADEITDAWNRANPTDQRQRSHVSKTMSVLSAKALVVRDQFYADQGKGPLLLHFRMPLPGEDVLTATVLTQEDGTLF